MLLYGVSPADRATFAATAVILLVIAMAASYLPAPPSARPASIRWKRCRLNDNFAEPPDRISDTI